MEEDQANKSFFSEIISSISDFKFSSDGRYMLARDYLTLKIWDLNMESKPIKVINIHDHLKGKLCDLYENDCIFDKFECNFSGDGRFSICFWSVVKPWPGVTVTFFIFSIFKTKWILFFKRIKAHLKPRELALRRTSQPILLDASLLGEKSLATLKLLILERRLFMFLGILEKTPLLWQLQTTCSFFKDREEFFT